MLAAALSASAAWSLQGPPLDRRAVISGVLTTSALAPMPAFAKSKEKAKEKALQKETAKEAQQAMKEYKLAPRPELVGNAETGYSYKADTVKSGSTGELASYFKDKGDKVQATYAAERARSTGASADEAKRLAEQMEAKAKAERQAAYMEKRNRKSFDEIEIEKFCKTAAGKEAVDNVGRPMCR
jgi:hypothetical protein